MSTTQAAIKLHAYTVAEAAKVLGVTPTTIHRYLATGYLTPCDDVAGNIKLVDTKSLLAHVKRDGS